MWDIEVKETVWHRLALKYSFVFFVENTPIGKKLPSYIYIAKEAGSSPETVRKALRELQRHGVIEKTRLGYFVTSDETKVISFRHQYLTSIEKEYLDARKKVIHLDKGN